MWLTGEKPGVVHTRIVLHSPDLNPTRNLWDVLEKALFSDQALPSSIQDLGEKLLQH